MGRECFEALTEAERQQIYDLHQTELADRCKRNFQELLMEKADLFYQFRSSPAGTVTQDDILDITESLQEDGRYKALDRMDADRKLLLFQHLGFVHCPIREHCPAFPNCSDALVERIVSRKAARPPSWAADSNHLNLVLLGADKLSNELVNQIRSRCPDSEFEHGGQMFSLEFRVISGDVDLPQNTFRTPEFLPHGCFCVYSDVTSYEYIRSSLEKTLLSNLEQEDRLPFQGLPLVILFQSDASLGEKEALHLRDEGQNLADSLQCPFIDVGYEEQVEGVRVVAGVVEDALRSLVESIRHRSGLLNIAPASGEGVVSPDLRVIMCMLCGDPYSVEKVLGPLLGHQTCFLSGDRSVCVEQQVGDSVKKVEVILSSYHSAVDFREELIHGFILVYSTRRRASIATLSAFSINIPELPIQIVAVTEGIGSNNVYSADLSQSLIAEGNNLADRLNAHFMTSTVTFQQKNNFYQPFFKEVSDKKAEIEKAFSLDERLSGRLDDSGEGTLERPIRRQPLPPPRIDSYIRAGPPSLNSRSGSGRSGSGSEIYERLPDSGSHGDEIEVTGSDDSDMYSHVDSLDREGIRSAPRLNGTNSHSNSHLPVKPSQIKSRRKQDLFRQSYPSSESLPSRICNNAPVLYLTAGHAPPPDCDPPPVPPFPGRPKFTANTPRDSPPAYSAVAGRTTGTESSSPKLGGGGRDSSGNTTRERPPPYSRHNNKSSSSGGSTFAPSSRGGSMFKAESMSLEAMRGSGNHSSFFREQGWVDDSNIFSVRVEEDDLRASHFNQGAFTTGRRAGGRPPQVKPRAQAPAPPAPGKLNMNDFHNVSDVLKNLQLGGPGRHAPLAGQEDLDGGYAVPMDNVNSHNKSEYAQPMPGMVGLDNKKSSKKN